MSLDALQREICFRFGLSHVESPMERKVGIARNVRDGILPIHGLRHEPVGDTTGWYIWAGGEPSQADDFFLPLHVAHLDDWCPGVMPYLGLPPGTRFLIAPTHEDVWVDPSLISEEEDG